MLTRVSGNLASIREATLIAPGVSEARFTPFANGPGTVEVTAIPVGNGPDESMLGQVRANIDIVRSAGTRVDVRGPRFVPVEIVVLLVFGPNVGEGLKPDIRLAAQDAILGYISSLRLGQQFIVNEMIQRIMDTDDRILDTEIRCFAFRRRAQVLRNFQPESDEVLIPDPKSEQPITVL
jgi:hypothetical protein